MGTNRLPAAAVPAAPESHETLARRELEQVRALIVKEAERAAELKARQGLLDLLMRERRMLWAEIADKEDGFRREMRKLTSRLEVLNREIKELLPPRVQPE